MPSTYYFYCETKSDSPWQREPHLTGTVCITEHEPDLEQLCIAFASFLRACGYGGIGEIEIGDPYCPECERRLGEESGGGDQGVEGDDSEEDQQGDLGGDLVWQDEHGVRHRGAPLSEEGEALKKKLEASGNVSVFGDGTVVHRGPGGHSNE